MRVLFGGVKVWRRIKAVVFLEKRSNTGDGADWNVIVRPNRRLRLTDKIWP